MTGRWIWQTIAICWWGTLESYRKVQAYYGLEQVIPIYVEVEDGLRLSRAVERNGRRGKAEVCRAVPTVPGG